MSESSNSGDGTRGPPKRNTRRGVVTKVYPHTQPDDHSNYEVDVRLVDGEESADGPQSGAPYTRIPVEVSSQGEVRGIEEGQLVNVAYYENESESPYVSGVDYSLEDRAPLAHPGDWRQRHDAAVFETIRQDDDGRLIRIGHQPDDRDDLDSGFNLDTAAGGFELYDSEGNGLCCDGDGNVVLSKAGNAAGGLSGGNRQQSEPVETSAPTPPRRPGTSDAENIGGTGLSIQSADADTDVDVESESVDLSAQGIAEGDVIDPYLEEFFRDGMTVYVPPGTYTWNGGGLSGDYQNAELIGGVSPGDIDEDGTLPSNPPQTVLAQSDGWTGTAAITCTETGTGGRGGSVHLRNLTITGLKGADPVLSLAVEEPDAAMVLESVHIPDGDTTAATDPAVIVEASHSGTLHLRNMLVEGFRYGGVHAAAPGQISNGGRRGRTIVAGGLFRDNNIANLRVAGMGSQIRQVTSIQTGAAVTTGATFNPRAIWFSDNVEAELVDSDIIYQAAQGPAVVLGAGAETDGTTTGFLDGNRIQHDHTDTIINVFSGEWSGSANHFTGTGNLTPNGGDFAGTCRGDRCETPDRAPREVS